jgi:hypothetical protein
MENGFKLAFPGTPERRQQDKDMILNPDNWPMWPRLPLKRTPQGDRPNCGFVFNGSTHDDAVQPIVYLALIFSNVVDEKLVYQDIDALLDDGWTVD